ncbi:MAG: HDOD domain-containing protein [Deltaproteobacteria bacterium]
MTAPLVACEPTDDVEPIRTQLDSAIDALEQTAAHPDDPAFLEELRCAARGTGLEPPQLPEDLARVRLVLSDPNAGPRDLARAIRHNPVIAAQFIGLANSAFFAGRHRIEHIDEAVVRVGMKKAAAWVTAIIAKASLFMSVGYRTQAREVFRHSLATAINAQLVADTLLPSASAEAFTVGLLHDFGRVFVYAIAGGQYAEASKDRGAPSASMLMRAADELHAGFSGLIARTWAFDHRVVAAILDHHAPLKPLDEDEPDELRLTRILQAADELGHRMIDNISDPELSNPTTIDLVGTFDTIDELLDDAREAYEAFESALN